LKDPARYGAQGASEGSIIVKYAFSAMLNTWQFVALNFGSEGRETLLRWTPF